VVVRVLRREAKHCGFDSCRNKIYFVLYIEMNEMLAIQRFSPKARRFVALQQGQLELKMKEIIVDFLSDFRGCLHCAAMSTSITK
jgi:hypothetical protein